jgi:hypothetical protein
MSLLNFTHRLPSRAFGSYWWWYASAEGAIH